MATPYRTTSAPKVSSGGLRTRRTTPKAMKAPGLPKSPKPTNKWQGLAKSMMAL